MVKVILAFMFAAVVLSGSQAEARGGRRMSYQQGYSPYYYNYNNTGVPTLITQSVTTAPAATSTPSATSTTSAPQSAQASSGTAPAAAAKSSDIVQTNAVEPAAGVVQAGGTPSTTAPATSTPAAAPAKTTTAAPQPAAVGSAQWKAEQCARMNSVMHLGGGFGGGAFEGCGFGATREQAIQGSCFWGQRTPIEIGVAQGSNGYYAVIFYR